MPLLIKYFTSTAFICFAWLNGLAQINLSLENKKYSFQATDYYIQNIIDDRPSKIRLGGIFMPNGAKKALTITPSTERAFLTHISKNLNQNIKGLPLVIRIKELSFTEKRTSSNYLVTGQARLKLEVYSNLNRESKLLCKPRSSTSYEFSLGNMNAGNYEQILQGIWQSSLNYLDKYVKDSKANLEVFNTGSQVEIIPFSKINKGDTVHYHSRKVTWNDFQALPSSGSKYAAAIFPSIAIDMKLSTRNNKLTATITPQVYMLKNQSWVKNTAKTNSALKHEQLHFDIAQVAMNRLLLKLQRIKASTMDDLSSMIQYEYLQAYTALNKTQEAYDRESNHNLNKPMQNKWAEKVAIWLKE